MKGGGINVENKKGGEVIASGGFGCIFDPALKCSNNDPVVAGQVSKLMFKKYAIAEYEDTLKYKKLLENIPNYRKYFFVDGFSICDPAPLSIQDLKGYKTKCSALSKKNITRKKVNNHLDELKMITMPYGGEDLGDHIQKNTTSQRLAQVNDSLLDLLENGIMKMNDKGVYHLDIKESNILVDVTTSPDTPIVKLIDWGLSCTYKMGDKIPDALLRRSFQYNAPMSIMILHTTFRKKYDELLSNIPSPDFEVVHEFVSEYLLTWIEERGVGHFKIIHEILEELFKIRKKKESKEETDFSIDTSVNYSEATGDQKYVVTFNVVVDYLTEILVQYTFEGRSNIFKYFKDVFIKIVDIWGFIMSYSPMLEHYYNNYSNLTKPERKVYAKLRDIFMDYLFASPLNVINLNMLKTDLTQLSVLLRKVIVNSRKTSSAISILDEATNDDTTKKKSKKSKNIFSAIFGSNNS
jgi:serine/threonine protein kinase